MVPITMNTNNTNKFPMSLAGLTGKRLGILNIIDC